MLRLIFEVDLYRTTKTKGNHEVSNTEVKVVVDVCFGGKPKDGLES